MDDDPPNPDREQDAKIEQDIRQARKFSAKEALARLAGPGALQGASPVSPVQQAETEIGCWLRSNMTDTMGILPMLVHRQLKTSDLLLNNLDQPLVALALHCTALLQSDGLLKELVREADVEWGHRMDERPRFQREGHPADVSDPYTMASVTRALNEVLQLLPDRVSRP